MGRERHRIKHEYHDSFRAAMRVVGPILILVGAVMFVTGILSFSEKFHEVRSFFDPGKVEHRAPDRFWMCFVGMPIAIVGIVCTRIGFLGAAARYVAGETAPVARDTVNYVLDGTKETIREVAQAVRGEGGPDVACPKCGHGNDTDAKFCDECGTALARACPKCGKANDADAKFCDDCGVRL